MLTWLNIVQFVIIGIVVYAYYISFIRNTSSEKLVRGLFGLGVIWALLQVCYFSWFMQSFRKRPIRKDQMKNRLRK